MTPEWGVVKHYPLALEPSTGGDNATDEVRVAITINCAWARWFHFAAADLSGASTLATLIGKAVRSA
jgi:hypothetical protein